MSIARGLLSLGRRFHQQTFRSAVVIRREAGKTRNQDSGQIETAWATIYEGPAELKFGEGKPRDVDAAGQRLAEQTPLLKLPLAGTHALPARAVRLHDVGEVTANEDDPGVVGLRFRIDGRHGQTLATARRLPVVVISHA